MSRCRPAGWRASRPRAQQVEPSSLLLTGDVLAIRNIVRDRLQWYMAADRGQNSCAHTVYSRAAAARRNEFPNNALLRGRRFMKAPSTKTLIHYTREGWNFDENMTPSEYLDRSEFTTPFPCGDVNIDVRVRLDSLEESESEREREREREREGGREREGERERGGERVVKQA